ncbi:MAG: PQQ-binding-like beta-propeller repeat protein [Salinivirgaceae bacterium]|jgi:outer membrane protein assembly factor BamB|nr:PQQ-binding-like beta-propeller repeat protein [Salinivirgaceae bacterium]
MKYLHKICFLVLVVLVVPVMSQNNSSVKIAGEVSSDELPLKTYDLKWPIVDFRFENDTAILIFSRKNPSVFNPNPRGLVYLFNPENGGIKWSKKKRDLKVSFFGSNAVINGKDLSYHIDNLTGKRRWYTDIKLFYWNTSEEMAYGMPVYNVPGMRNDKFRGVSTVNGKTQWIFPVDMFSSLNEQYYLNESTHIYAAKNLFAIDPATGLKWKYNINTFHKIEQQVNQQNTELLVAAAILGGAMGVMLLYDYSIPSPYITNVNSNIIHDNNAIYFAGAEQIIAIEEGGTVLWQKSLPKKQMSSSILIDNDDKLILVNTGLAQHHQGIIQYGVPFVALLSKKTGALIRQKVLPKGFITDVLLTDKLIVSSSSNVFVTNPETLEFEAINKSQDSLFSVEKILETVYTANDNGHIEKLHTTGKNLFMEFSNGYHHYNEIDSLTKLERKNVYSLLDTVLNHNVYMNKRGHFRLTDMQNQTVVSFSFPGNAYIRRNQLLIFNDRKMNIIDLKKLLNIGA